MTTGLRDQLVTLYAGTDTESDNGFGGQRYVFAARRWASVTYTAGDEATVAGQAQQGADAVLTMDDDGRPLPEQIDANGAFRDARGRFFRVTDAGPHLRSIVATGVYADDAAATVVEEGG